MNFPVLEPPRVILHIVIPGPPQVLVRAKAGGVIFSAKSGRYVPRFYDPSSKQKELFQWQVKAQAPTLKPEATARIGIKLEVWTADDGVAPGSMDGDNALKFYLDALSAPPPPKKRKQKDLITMEAQPGFGAWINDRQVDEMYVRVHRNSTELKIEILVYEVE